MISDPTFKIIGFFSIGFACGVVLLSVMPALVFLEAGALSLAIPYFNGKHAKARQVSTQ